MENHHHHPHLHRFLFKVSRLFPSSLTSCQSRARPDVAESSITIPKSKNSVHDNDLFSPNIKPHHEKSSFVFSKKMSAAISDAEGRKCPPVIPISYTDIPMSHQKKKDGNSQEIYGNGKKINSFRSIFNLQSSSSNSGWFSSGDEKYPRADDGETDGYFSLSSYSGGSFRLKTSRRFKPCEEMESIDENGRCSFSSSMGSFDSVLSRRKTGAKPAGRKGRETQMKSGPEYDPGSDQISTQIYYSNNRAGSRKSSRRRRTSRTHRKTIHVDSSERSLESYAVETKSSDPRADFRTSIVEMIVEKQMSRAEDLERLLHCFLSLNAASYHGIILEVFSDICETLFCN